MLYNLYRSIEFLSIDSIFSVAMLSGMLPWTIADQEIDEDYRDFRRHNYTEDPCWQNMSIPAMKMIVKMLTHNDAERPKISWLADEVNGPKWYLLFDFIELDNFSSITKA